MRKAFSRIGFGTARTLQGSEAHEAALAAALRAGVSLIDTSANYGAGGSERLVGDALRAYGEEAGAEAAAAVTVVSKFGWIQDEAVGAEGAGAAGAKPLPAEATVLQEGLTHSIHPTVMREQLAASRERLGFAIQERGGGAARPIDCYMLHNPEYFLVRELRLDEGAGKQITEPQQVALARGELDRRMVAAFAALEEEVRAGTIGSYGVSSGAFALGANEVGALPYETLPALAAQAARTLAKAANGAGPGGSGLAAVQFPANLLEPNGLAGVGQWARSHGLHSLVHRPLTGLDGGQAWRLAQSVDDGEDEPLKSAEEQNADWDSVMRSLFTHFTPPPPAIAGQPSSAESALADACAIVCQLASELDRDADSFASFMEYEDRLMQSVVPVLSESFEDMDEGSTLMLQFFFERFGERMRAKCEARTLQHVASAPHGHALPEGQMLQHYALRWLLASQHVSAVLVGMTSEQHVASATSCLHDEEEWTIQF